MTVLKCFAVLAVSGSARTTKRRYVSRSGFCITDSRKSLFWTFWTRPVGAPVPLEGKEQKMKRAGFPEPLQRITPCSQSSGAQRTFAA